MAILETVQNNPQGTVNEFSAIRSFVFFFPCGVGAMTGLESGCRRDDMPC